MNEQVVIGIDPGLRGAIAAIRDGKFITAVSMPVEAKAKKGERVDSQALYDALRSVHEKAVQGTTHQVTIAVELVYAMPFLGASSMLSLGDSFGCARTAACLIIPAARIELVPPATWKRFTKTQGKQKKYSVVRARALFPDCRSLITHPKKHEGLAEALLIAYYVSRVVLA